MDKSQNSTEGTAPVVYNWSVPKYIRLVENTQNPTLREFEQVELDYLLNKIANPQNKTFIDVGAGYGRVLPHIAPPRTRNIIAVEISDSMFSQLQKRASQYPNVVAIKGDANNLSQLLNGFDIQYPVVLSLQNSLGTWEEDSLKAIDEMRRVAENGKGELIISLFKQEALKSRGVDMYRSLEALVGEIDWERTDFEKGIFRTKKGYLSHWRTKEEREKIREVLGGQLVALVEHPGFSILHIAYN